MYPRTAAIPGKRDPKLTPYVIPIEREVARGHYKRVVAVMSAQTGKTELLLDLAGHRLDQRPAPILYVGPNKQFLQEQFEPRVMGLLDEAKCLRNKVARGKRMTKTRKVIAGVSFRLAHSGSSTALKSDPAALAFVDEFDEMRANINDQGGPLGLVERRGDTYADFVCVVTSTPKLGTLEVEAPDEHGLQFWKVAEPDDIDSPTWNLWQKGTRHHWCWPCPHCSLYFVPRFDLVRFPEEATPFEAARSTYVECPHCGGVIEEKHKEVMNANGRMIAPGQHVNPYGEVVGDPPETTTASWWVSGLASPFVTFGKRVQDYLDALLLGDTAMIQQAINAGFGELYDKGSSVQGQWSDLLEKSKEAQYVKNEVPPNAYYLVLTVDVQKHSLPYVIRAWGPRATSWLVDCGYIRGDTAEEDVWNALADLLTTPIDGKPINLCFVDSGFRPGKKESLPLNRVYQFCLRFPKRVRPTKGSSGSMKLPLIMSKIEVDKKGHTAGLELLRLDTDHWKQWVQERMAWPSSAIGAWHLHRDISEDYCHQMYSEVRVKKPKGNGHEWIRKTKSNHFFDCEAMQAAASHLLNAQRIPVPNNPDARAATRHPAAHKPKARVVSPSVEPASPREHDARNVPAPELPIRQPSTTPRRFVQQRRVARSSYMG